MTTTLKLHQGVDVELAERSDDWSSLIGSLGSMRDKHVGMAFARRPRLDRRQVESLYEQNPIAARVCDLKVDDAFREGWEFKTAVGVEDPAKGPRVRKGGSSRAR